MYFDFYRELRSLQGWSPHSIEEYREELNKMLVSDKFLVAASSEDGLVGFIRISEREGSYWFEELYVKPEYRGRGIGGMLVRAAENYVREHDSFVYIMVLPQHTRAIDFWKKMGYNILNTIELAKNLRGEVIDERRAIHFLKYYFEIYKWEIEDFSPIELQFLELIQEFRERGGTGEQLLQLFVRCLGRELGKGDEN